MGKKKNAHIALRESDVRRIKQEVSREAVENAFVIFFTVLHDKWGFGQERLARMVKQVDELSAMVNSTPHYVTIEQLKKNLKDELKIEF